MKEIIVSGGRRLAGVIEPSGSKNAALPVIFATLATRGVSKISNVADIGDVRVAIEIIESFGAVVKRDGTDLTINTEKIKYRKPERRLTSKIRASSYLIGACLSSFGIFHLSDFGGCNFCNRPIDMHLFAAQKLGADISLGVIKSNAPKGAKISFEKKSVGATMNALIMAATAKGETVIEGAAEEPHVRVLVEFLISAGADITFDNSKFIIKGRELHGGNVKIIPDMIEAGTYLLLAPLTNGEITVKNSLGLELESFLEPLSNSGISVSVSDSDITVSGVPNIPFSIKTAPHPGYPTDLQPQIAPLMANYFGGIIVENVWQNRFSYLDSLHGFGLNFCKKESRAIILPSKFNPAECSSPDLRGGAAAVMCALAAVGESRIRNADVVLRGYCDFEKKLKSLGAEIKIV